MSRIRIGHFTQACFWIIWMSVGGCSKDPANTGNLGSETNWLVTCSDNAECAKGSCLCGVCTQACSDDSTCATAAGPSTCAVASSAAFTEQCSSSSGGGNDAGGLTGICLPSCAAGSSCPAEQLCVDSSCTSTTSSRSVGDFVAAYCAAARRCCAAASFSTTPLVSCESEFVRQLNPLALLPYGAVVVDSSAMDQCVREFVSGTAECGFSWPASCGNAFVGTQSIGSPCRNSVECSKESGPVVCLKFSSTDVDGGLTNPEFGTCQAVEHGTPGAPCYVSCQTVPGCSMTSTIPLGSTERATCFESDGLFCDSTTSQCAPRVSPGGTCNDNDPAQCGTGYYCPIPNASAAGVTGVCTVQQVAETSCDTTMSNPCSSGLACVNGVCAKPPLGNSKTCSGNYD